jgi:biopolymer transport protein ExbD/biopolymer transport protein TolR
MAFTANKSGPGLHRPLADINVTPLVDVMLVLLIVFMITAPMLTTGLKMDLPQARSAVTLKPKPPLVISVTKEGKFALDMDDLPFEQLLPAVQARMEGDLKRVIQIRGDRNGSYGAVYELIDKLVINGFTHIALVSDPKARRAGASTQ